MPSIPVDERAICATCGVQYENWINEPPKNCKICDDPRQFVPAGGQVWTSHQRLLKAHHNEIHQLPGTKDCWMIRSEPQIAIGQRAILITTPHGNVLWDCITLLDEKTIAEIKRRGGLEAIVISHPHYYSTHMHWADTFQCPIYIATEDEEWTTVDDPSDCRRVLIEKTHQDIIKSVVAVKVGGHFPGSLLLHYEPDDAISEDEAILFVADTFVTAPSALYHVDRLPGTISYTFDWSIPNRIPLPPTEIAKIWSVLKGYKFGSTYGAFVGLDVIDPRLKARVLESMKIQCRAMGYSKDQAEIFAEIVD